MNKIKKLLVTPKALVGSRKLIKIYIQVYISI